MTAGAFWAWVWEQNDLRTGRAGHPRRGNRYGTTKADLARRAGFPAHLFRVQCLNGTWPTVKQARQMAVVLGVDFAEVEKRAELRPDQYNRGSMEEINTCLDCPLPDCEAGEKGCPFLRF